MKKFTFIATLLMLLCATAKAELQDKYFYKISTESVEGWTLQDAGRMTLTPGKDYLQVLLTNNGGRMINRFWNEEGWSKVTDLSTLPNNTYKFSFDLKQTVNATRTDMEFVLLPVGACSATDSRVSSHNYHWFNAQDADGYTGDAKEDFFFRYRVTASTAESFDILINERPNARGNWVDPTLEGSETATLAVNKKYTFAVEINVEANTATYTISDEDGATVKTGVHNYVCAEDRAGIWVMSANSANSVMQLSNMGLSYKKEGPFASEPTSELFWVEGVERDYMVSFGEGEVLHWIQLGNAEGYDGTSYTDGEEYTVAYSDAMDSRAFEQGEDPGRKIITCMKSGDLKMWTSMEADETNVSDDVIVNVVCEEETFPKPVATITNVEAGYGKEYTLSVDNSTVTLKPTITIHYTLTQGGTQTEGDLLSGEKINFTGVGTLALYSWDKSHLNECYGRSEVSTIQNTVEYEELVNKNYAVSFDEATTLGLTERFRGVDLKEGNAQSHWERIYSEEERYYAADGSSVASTDDEKYSWTKKGFGVIASSEFTSGSCGWNVYSASTDQIKTAFLPIVPAQEDVTVYAENGWTIFPLEGIVYDSTTGGLVANNAEVGIDPQYISDDESKPNFYVVHTRGGYDRPDKGDCNKTTVVKAGEIYGLYRFDTAICDVRVLTYKGFTPDPSAINGVVEKAQNSDNRIFNLAGQLVNGNVKGIMIKNGKKFIVK